MSTPLYIQNEPPYILGRLTNYAQTNFINYSTVTLLAKLRGLSTSLPRAREA